MEYNTSSRKKNTDNYHQERNDIFHEYNDDVLTIGQYETFYDDEPRQSSRNEKCYSTDNFEHTFCDDADDAELNDNDECHYQDTWDTLAVTHDYDNFSGDDDDTDWKNDFQLYTYPDVKHMFTAHTVVHVYMSYYPFKDEYTENKYKLYYFDPYNPLIKVCPACMDKFKSKIYVLSNRVIVCPNCYKHENTIKYI